MYCTQEELTQFVHAKILEKLDSQEPGIVARHIAGVSAEIDDALRPRFVVPLAHVPETIRRIARVITAYRAVGAITTVMDSAAASGNMWLPLQTLYKEAMADLAAIAAGKMDVGLTALGNTQDESPPAIMAHQKPGKFANDTYWKRF